MSDRSAGRLSQAYLGLGSFVLIVAALYFGRDLLIPIFTAILFTFILNPLVSALRRRGLGRAPAICLVVGFVFLLLGAIFFTFFVQVKELALELPQYKHQVAAKVDELRLWSKTSWLSEIVDAVEDISQSLRETSPPSEQVVPVKIEVGYSPWLQSVAGSAISFFVHGGLVFLLVIFMLLHREDFRNRLLRLGGSSHLGATTRALDEASSRISKYLLMQALINSAYGAAFALGLLLIGVPFWFIWGFLGGLSRYLPYVGPWLAACPPLLTTVAVLPGWAPFFMVGAYLIILEVIAIQLIEFWLFGKTTGIAALALLIAVAFWTWLWGPLGLVLATPITTCVLVLGRHVPALEFLTLFLGDEPVLPAHVILYQRLLARDLEEAMELTEQYLDEHGLEATYDELLIPALAFAKQDQVEGELGAAPNRDIALQLRVVFADVVLPKQETAWAEVALTYSEAPGRALVFGLPCHQELDEVGLEMFQAFLDPAKFEFKLLSSQMLQAEVLSRIREEHPQVVLLGTLSRGRLIHAQNACKRIHNQFPEQEILVGCWGLEAVTEALRARLVSAGANKVSFSFEETRGHLDSLRGLTKQVGAA